MRLFAVATLSFTTLLLAGCPGNGLGSCGVEADVTGSWTIHMGPAPLDGGVDETTITGSNTITATLVQHQSTNVFGIGKLIWGTLDSADPTYFSTLSIPPLTSNNGSKTGEELGCTLKINVPIATPVTDDNTDQGPNRISLVGDVVEVGHMLGDPIASTVILASDASATVRNFSWTATQTSAPDMMK